jgi:hypothetical protein
MRPIPKIAALFKVSDKLMVGGDRHGSKTIQSLKGMNVSFFEIILLPRVISAHKIIKLYRWLGSTQRAFAMSRYDPIFRAGAFGQRYGGSE